MHPKTKDIDCEINEMDIFSSFPIGNWAIYENNDTGQMRFKLKDSTEIRKMSSSKYNELFTNPDDLWKITFDT